MTATKHPSYTVLKADTSGRVFELTIPADAVKSPRETNAAFHRRVATGERDIASGTRTSACTGGPHSEQLLPPQVP